MTTQLVPVEPTEAMIQAGQDSGKNCAFSYAACYRAMLAAAPSAPMPEPANEREALLKAAHGAIQRSEIIGEHDWFTAPEIVFFGAGAISEADAVFMAACNPELIAALSAPPAPAVNEELLEALKGLLHCAGEELSSASDEVLLEGVGDGPDDLTREQAQAFLTARAAIARATAATKTGE
jgi:hypothetical protein